MRTLIITLLVGTLCLCGFSCRKKLGYKKMKNTVSVTVPNPDCDALSEDIVQVGEHVIRTEAEYFAALDTNWWGLCDPVLPEVDFNSSTLICACYSYNFRETAWDAEMTIYYNEKKDDYDVFTKYMYKGNGGGNFTTGCICKTIPAIREDAAVSFKSKGKYLGKI